MGLGWDAVDWGVYGVSVCSGDNLVFDSDSYASHPII